MKTTAIIHSNGTIKMGNAISGKDAYTFKKVYLVHAKPMKQIWKDKIDELDEIIDDTKMHKNGRIIQLYRERSLLELAFNNTGNTSIVMDHHGNIIELVDTL